MSAARRARFGALALGVACGLASCAPPDVQKPAALLGRWVGSVSYRDASTPLALDVRADGDSLAATLDAPALGVLDAPVGRVHAALPAIAFAVPLADGDTLRFEGWFRRTLWVGAVSSHAIGRTDRLATAPQFGFRRPVSVKNIAGVDSSLDETQRAVPAGATSTALDTLAHWILARGAVR